MAETPPIPLRHLGETSLQVTPIGLGVMQFSGGRGFFGMVFPDLEQSEMSAIIQAALDGGINWFDSAEMYGLGRSERALAAGLRDARREADEVVVATKWLPLLRTASHIRRSIDTRMRQLDGYRIDLYMIHQPWSFSSPEAEMDAMADLVEAGKVCAVGVSNFSAERMRRAHAALARRGLPLAVNQVEYSLLARGIERDGVLEAAKELGVTIVAWAPLARGVLSGKFHRQPKLYDQAPLGRKMMLRGLIERSRPIVEVLEEIATQRRVTPSQVALNWAIHYAGQTVVAIPGASQVEHAREAAGAMKFRLTDEEFARLDEVSRPLR